MALNPINLSNLLTFTTDPDGTRVNAAGLIERAVTNQPRFDFHPTTGQFLGILCEEARTNHLLRSQEFDNASWTKTRATISANATTAPDGTLTADKLVEDATASNTHFTHQSFSVTSGVTYTVSVFAKAVERSVLVFNLPDAHFEVNSHCSFNLATQESTTAIGTAEIKPFKDDWYRCQWTVTAIATATTSISFHLAATYSSLFGATSYTGDGVSGIYVWGAQLEPGSFLTSYIPTDASANTRSADIATATVTSLLNPDEGTLVVEYYKTSLNSETERFACLDDGTNSNRVHIIATSANNLQALITSGGTTQAAPTVAAPAAPGAVKVAAAWKLNDFVLAVNGAVAATDVSGAVPVGMTTLRVGSGTASNEQANSQIKAVTYYPTRLTNTELEQVTTL